MHIGPTCLLLTIVSASLLMPASAAEPDKEIAGKAAKILNSYCFRCHRGQGSTAGRYAFNARDRDNLIEDSMVIPADLDNSQLLDAMNKGRMPPRNQSGLPRPTPAEVDVVRQWIKADAPAFPAPAKRGFLSLDVMMQSIHRDYQQLQPSLRSTTRYFTLVNLHNDPSVDARQLRLARAALFKTVNSLSWEPQLVVPRAIDESELIYAINITDLGWSRAHWATLTDEYPYEIPVELVDEEGRGDRLRNIDRDLKLLSGGDNKPKHIRVDWLVSVGLRPKLYHKLLYDLYLPSLARRPDAPLQPANPKSMTDRDLENYLRIDVRSNIEQAKAKRAGFSESGVSSQNRLVERHPAPGRGYYWKSYDFLGSNSRANLAEFPLGPRGYGNDQFTFLHDGGEIVFSLPNGLQGYLLVTKNGDRIDAGPIEIVGDALKTSGTQAIINGLSCIACHRRGIVEPPDDEARANSGAFGVYVDRIRDLYPPPEQFRKLLDSDARQFEAAMQELLGPVLLKGEDQTATLDSLPEPVGETARHFFLEPMNIDTVASELFYPSAQSLQARIQNDSQIRQIGLGQLRQEHGTIKREAWQNMEGRSLMQIAADLLGFAPAK